MRAAIRGPLVALLGLFVATIGGCGDSDEFSSPSPTPTVVPLTSEAVLQPGPYGVGVTTILFTDNTRPTMPNGTFQGSPRRQLNTEIWYPAGPGAPPPPNEQLEAPLAATGHPFPLVIYSHAFLSGRTGGSYLGRHLASYGYVVASPDFPLSNSLAPGGSTAADLVNQPGDVSFVIDQVMALDRFAGAIDAQRIGLTGLSLGGMTTLLATFHPTLRDPRVRAAAPVAGGGCFFTQRFFGDRAVPLLIVHGDLDAIIPYAQNAPVAYAGANRPKYLVTLLGGTHTGFSAGTELFDYLDNVDTVGCFELRGLLQSGDESAFLDSLGGADAGLVDNNCPGVCLGPRQLPVAITAARQQVLTIASVFPFFEAYLRGDRRAQQFLEQTLAAENAEIHLDFTR